MSDTDPDAPETPHAPTTAPSTPQRGSVDGGDGSEALRARARLLMAICDEAPCWLEQLGGVETAVVSVSDASMVAARVLLAYGDQRAAEALREAANEWDRRDKPHLEELTRLGRERYRPGGPSMPAIWLRLRADELHGRQA